MLVQHAHDAVQAIYELLWHALKSLLAPLSLVFANTFGIFYASLTPGRSVWLGDSFHIANMVKISLANVLALGSISVTSELVRAQTCPDYTTFSMVHRCFYPLIAILRESKLNLILFLLFRPVAARQCIIRTSWLALYEACACVSHF